MPISVECPQCGKGYRVGDDKAGRKMKCKECDAVVTIPAGGDEFGDDEFDDIELPRPRRKSSGSSAKSSKTSSRKTSRGKSSSFTSPVQLIVGGVVAVVAAGIVWFILAQRGYVNTDGGETAGKDNPEENTPVVAGNNTPPANSPSPTPGGGNRVGRTAPKRPAPAAAPPDVQLQPTTTFTRFSDGPKGQPMRFRLTVYRGGRKLHSIEGDMRDESSAKPMSEPENGMRGTPAGSAKSDPLEAAREAARQAELGNRLRSISLAMHSYHEVYNQFPSSYRQGSGLSWRVHLLPYLGGNALYQQFKLKEPWDSAHNKTLIAKMPAIFAAGGGTNDGKSRLHVFVGPRTPFGSSPAGAGVKYDCMLSYAVKAGGVDPAAQYRFMLEVFPISNRRAIVLRNKIDVPGSALKEKSKLHWTFKPRPVGTAAPLRMRDIIDGTSNTILAVVGGPETAAIWTKPGGIPFDQANPIAALGTVPKSGFVATMFNGSLLTIPADVSAAVLARMIIHQDGDTQMVADFIREQRSKVRPEVMKANEAAKQKMHKLMLDFASAVKSARNRATSRTATAKITKLAARAHALNTELRALPRLNAAEDALFERANSAKLQEALKQVVAAMVWANLRKGADPAYDKAIEEFGKAISKGTAGTAKYMKDREKLLERQKGKP